MSITPLRQESIDHIEYLIGTIPTEVKDILDIGIAGDVKPGGNYYLFPGKNYKTMDIVSELEPDYVQDITMASNNNELAERFDLIILSNTLEHVFKKEEAIEGCTYMLKPGGYLIVDIPWMYPFHESAGSGDYWRISADGLEKMLEREGFKDIKKMQGKHCSTVMGVR